MDRREPTARNAVRPLLARAVLTALLATASALPCCAQDTSADSTTANPAEPTHSAPALPAAAVPPTPVASPSATPTSASSPLPLPRIGGYVQAREFMQEDVGLTALLNRVRFSITGVLPARFSYSVLTEWQAVAGARLPSTVSLREAIVRWSPAPFTITAGEFKTPFTREYLIPVPELELADLAVAVDSIAPRYDVGFMAEYALGATANLAIGAFNGEGANTSSNRDSTVLLVGRLPARPIAQLSLGASGTRDGDDSLRWGVDAQAQHRGLAYGANFDLAPNRLRLLLEMSRRVTGAQQLATDIYIAQIQARF